MTIEPDVRVAAVVHSTVAKPRLPQLKFLPEIAAVLLVITWASTFILTKDAYNQITPMAYSFARYLSASLLGLVVLFLRGWRTPARRATYWRIDRSDFWRFTWCGLFGFAIYQVCFSVGLAHTSAFASSLLTSLIPLFSLILVTSLGERPARPVWLGVIVAIAGVTLFLAQGGGGSGMWGNLLCLGAAACFAVYSEIIRPLVKKYPAETVAAYTTFFGSIPLFAIAMPEVLRQDWTGLEPKIWLMVAYTVTLPIYLALIVWNWIISQRGVAATGWNLLVPIASGIMAMIFLGDSLVPIQVVGALLALCGLILMQRGSLVARTRQRTPDPGPPGRKHIPSSDLGSAIDRFAFPRPMASELPCARTLCR
ncbi:MAG TPA: DMT family transporter [Thermomicrobiales bacterium]|nr:DMT family transporter [Thermomicrobiales bacterium]